MINKYLIRERNEAAVATAIIAEQPISRADVSVLTGLNKATITNITKDLIEKNLIAEVGVGDTSAIGGRKPIFLAFNAQAGTALAIDIGYNYLSGLATFLDGTKIATANVRPVKISRHNIIGQLTAMIEELTHNLPATPHGIIGLSLAIHGIVNKNHITFTTYYDLDHMDLAGELQKFYDFPVLLENEANLTALAEHSFSKNYRNLVSLSVHSGIGAGVIINDQLYTGPLGQAGEIGHTILVPDGRPCPCGNHGCLEQYTSNKIMFEEYAKKMSLEQVNSDTFVAAILAKNPIATALIEENLRLMAICLNNVATLFDPEVIFINSSVYRKAPELVEKLQSRLTTFRVKNTIIKTGSLADLATLYGGVVNLTRHFLHSGDLHFPHPLNN